MLRRRSTRLRMLVGALVVASLGIQPASGRTAAPVGRHAQALAAAVPMAETLALPPGRGHGDLAVEQRGRSPMPVVAVDEVAAVRERPLARAGVPVARRARSHPIRRVQRAPEDPPPH